MDKLSKKLQDFLEANPEENIFISVKEIIPEIEKLENKIEELETLLNTDIGEVIEEAFS